MKKWIIVLWILLMIAALANMALQNKVDKLEDEKFNLYAEVQSLKEVIDSEHR